MFEMSKLFEIEVVELNLFQMDHFTNRVFCMSDLIINKYITESMAKVIWQRCYNVEVVAANLS